MKISYIKLQNVMGLIIGSNRENIEIDFSKSINKIISIQATNGKGKALPNSTKIPTPDGYKLMGDLKVGDLVFDENGNPTKVIGVYPQGKKDIWEIEFSHGRKAKCCKDHLWEYTTGDKNYYVESLEYILNNYSDNNSYLRNVIIKNNKLVNYNYQKTMIDSYNFGKYIGSGCNRNLKKFKEFPDLIDNHIPDSYIYNSKKVRISFLTGLLRANKLSIEYKYQHSTISVIPNITSSNLSNDIVRLIRSLGLNAIVYQENENSNEFSVNICIIGDMYSSNNNEFISMKKITKLDYREETKCIMVENKNGLFLTEDFIVTHNTVLLSSMSPFASTTSLDERSSLPYIKPGENGYKEIHYINDDDKYIIKHHYKPTKDNTHTTKSYFTLNGEELNESGNVTSFLTLVELHFGLTQEMMRLMRLGSNVNSFITLSPTRRKEYIGKLIEQIDLYLKIHKKVSEDIRVLKILMTTNNNSLYECHISDILLEEDKLSKINKNIKQDEREYDKIVAKISKIESLENENNIIELKNKRREIESSLLDINKTEEIIKQELLEKINIDSLINKRSEILNNRIETLSKINSHRIIIDNTMKNIERLEMDIKKLISNNDIQSLELSINSIKEYINGVNSHVIKFISNCSSDDIYHIVTKLSSFNQIGNMIHTLGNRSINTYIRLIRENKSIDNFLYDQNKKNINRISDSDLKRFFDQIFKDDEIITPNCDTQFNNCPYYRISEMLTVFREKLDEEVFDDETLNYIQIISNNMDKILNQLDELRIIDIPDNLRSHFKEKTIIDRLESKLQLFDLTEFEIYLSLSREHEIYMDNVRKLERYESQLRIINTSGIDSQLKEIENLKKSIVIYKKDISDLEKILSKISLELENIDRRIGLITKYNDGVRYKKILESTLESTNKILIPLETSGNEKIELKRELDIIRNKISFQREESKKLENKINEYKILSTKSEILNKKFKDYEFIERAVSTRKGIPVLYMKKYLGKIQNLANTLLDLIYNGDLRLGKFQVTPDTFEVPYIRNDHKIPDVKYASQSELSLITMALSFALADKASGKYNILLLDEIDSGLDDDNRSAFLKMLYKQMEELHSEQVFLISHNLSMISNLPMDVIKLSEIDIDSKLQNVIYS